MSCNCTDEYNKCLGSWYAYASWTNTKLILNELETLDSETIIKYLATINENLNTLTTSSEECCTKTQRKLNRIIKLINEATSDVKEWEAGVDYEVSDEVMYKEIEYNCIQSHTSQNDFTPDICPALWGTTVIKEETNEVMTMSVGVETAVATICDEVAEVEEYVVTKKGKTKKVKKK